MASHESLEVATFGGGCFWCTQAVFDQLRGVARVTCGYGGGTTPDPTYEQVCTGTTGHAELVRIEFDPQVITYDNLLEIFFQTHDPTTLNRQGNDVGTQYRSVIFWHDDAQREAAEAKIRQFDQAGAFPGPIVTEVAPAANFFPAEEYHQDYFASHPSQPYCAAVIRPKLDKFLTRYQDFVKE